MIETLKNAFRNKDIRKKIIFTLLLLLLFRVGCYIPIPGLTRDTFSSAVTGNDFLSLMSGITGSALANGTLFALGIGPYINASIIMQLLTVGIPALERLSKQGEEGRKKITNITRLVTIILAIVQSIGIIVLFGQNEGAINTAYFGNVPGGIGETGAMWIAGIFMTIVYTAGSCLVMWIGERITENGVGNGISLLIFAGIISNFAGTIGSYIYTLFVDISQFPLGNFIGMIVVFLVLIVGVVFVDLGERRVPVQYAKRVVGRKMYGGQSTHIPLKINASGVLPLIFASAIMQFPATIFAFFPNSSINQWWNANVHAMSWGYQVIFALLIIAFTFFYSSISFNPVEIAKNMQQNGGMIPGIRQGKPTSDFILKISRRITLFGALFLALLAVLPTLIYALCGVSLPFAASSLLIAVSVAMETMRQLESQMTMRHYKGFLN